MKCAFVTFGCKINFYDTQALRESVLDLGYREVPPSEPADVYVVNACTVTARAGDKSGAAVRRLARRHPDAAIIVTGCLTEPERAGLRDVPGVFHVVGNEEKDQVPALLDGHARRPVKGRKNFDLLGFETTHFAGRTRAFLKVQDGCDEFCSYCVIPHLRGSSRSRPMAAVLAEAQRLAANGHRELVLTGIHLSRYGRDLGHEDGLVELLDLLTEIDGVHRVRLSSIGEGAFSEPFLQLFESKPALCRFFHMPLQSGSDAVLKRMRRDYDVATYLDTVARIRSRLPGSLIATDLMVGFPGESDAEFDESLATCERVGFGRMHLFPYSPRPRTEAARLPGHLAPAVRDERMARARALEARLARAAAAARRGRRHQVLFEQHRGSLASGLSREGWSVSCEVPLEPSLRNVERWVEVDDVDGARLRGRLLADGEVAA